MNTDTNKTSELLKRREQAVPRGPFNIGPIFAERAQGAELWDVDGKRYIDFCGGIGVINVGHNHPKVVDAIRAQSEKFIHTCWHVAMYEEYVRLAERLNEKAPIAGSVKSVFFNSGAEASENAIKISRNYTKRQGVVCFERAFHGRTMLGMTLTGKVLPYTKGFGPFVPEVYRLPWRPFFGPELQEISDNDVRVGVHAALSNLFNYEIGADDIACIIAEPVLGEGGFYAIHQAAFEVLRDVCTEHGIVLISDEVQSGFGRCGALFACERYGVEPDLIPTAKSIAGGLPLSGVTGKAEIMDAPGVGGIGGTFGGNAMACAAANAVLDIFDDGSLFKRADEIGEKVVACFREMESEHDFLKHARGLGAMCAVDFVDPETGSPNPELAKAVMNECRDRGLMIMLASGNILRTLMPLVITDEQLDEAMTIMRDAAESVSS